MANNFKIRRKPHINKDGSESSRRRDFIVIYQGRTGVKVETRFSNQDAAESFIDSERKRLQNQHLQNHPNDEMYKRKHKIGEK